MRIGVLSSPWRWLSAAFAAACPTSTVHGRALLVSSDPSPMPSIWHGYVAWCANESTCATIPDAPTNPTTARSSDGWFSRGPHTARESTVRPQSEEVA